MVSGRGSKGRRPAQVIGTVWSKAEPAELVRRRGLIPPMRAGVCLAATGIVLLMGLAPEMPGIIQAATPGTITGVLTNGTSRSPVPNAELSLLEMGAGGATVVARGRSDGAGRFRFAGLDFSGGRTFLVTTTYRDAPYSSAALPVTARTPVVVADVSVFEPTSDASVVVVSFRVIMVQQVLPGRLVFRDVIGLQSRESRAFIGQGTGAARIALPTGASSVQVIRGMVPLGVADSAVVDALPITPRVREAVLQYEVGYRLTRATLRWPLGYPTGSVDLILPDGVQVRAVNLTAQAPGQVRGQRLLRFTAEQVPAGRDVLVELVGLPLNVRPYLIAFAGLLLTAALVAALAGPMVRRRRIPPPLPEGSSEVSSPVAPGHGSGSSG